MLNGQLHELNEMRYAIAGSARQLQSYPVAREAMQKLINRIAKRIIDHTATLKELTTNASASTKDRPLT